MTQQLVLLVATDVSLCGWLRLTSLTRHLRDCGLRRNLFVCRLAKSVHISFLSKRTSFDFCTFFCSSNIASSLAGLLDGNVHRLLDGVVVGCWIWLSPFGGLVAPANLLVPLLR